MNLLICVIFSGLFCLFDYTRAGKRKDVMIPTLVWSITLKPFISKRPLNTAKMIRWGEFKNPVYNSYQFGFPLGTNQRSIFPSAAFHSQERLPSNYNLISYIAHKCIVSVDVCSWGRLMEWTDIYPKYNNDLEKLSIMAIYIACEITFGQAKVCPAPCKKDPCAKKSHVTNTKCEQLNYGMYVDDFKCECDVGYDWNKHSLECKRIDLCKSKTRNPCITTNTDACFMETTSKVTCNCNEQFMGKICSKARNACLENFVKGKPSGFDACGVHGTCKPVTGTNQYSCSCKNGYTDDQNIQGRDCKKRDAKCDDFICLNGYCLSSKSQKRAKCICDDGYGGKDCTEELPMWNAWLPWGPCRPKCGSPMNQYRRRSCNSNDPSKPPCKGNKEDFRECAPVLCKVDGKWESWDSWSDCSFNCGGGKKTRTRECYYDTQEESAYGRKCRGSSKESRNCNMSPCRYGQARVQQSGYGQQPLPPAIGWSLWSQWSPCNVNCGHGEMKRLRECTGSTCHGKPYEAQQCQASCPPGVYPWGVWSSWSHCTGSTERCTRSRSCPFGKGKCPGFPHEKALCVKNLCNGENSMSILELERQAGTNAAAALAKSSGTSGVGENGGYKQVEVFEKNLNKRTKTKPKKKKIEEIYDSTNTGTRVGVLCGVVFPLCLILFCCRKRICSKCCGGKKSSEADGKYVPRRRGSRSDHRQRLLDDDDDDYGDYDNTIGTMYQTGLDDCVDYMALNGATEFGNLSTVPAYDEFVDPLLENYENEFIDPLLAPANGEIHDTNMTYIDFDQSGPNYENDQNAFVDHLSSPANDEKHDTTMTYTDQSGTNYHEQNAFVDSLLTPANNEIHGTTMTYTDFDKSGPNYDYDQNGFIDPLSLLLASDGIQGTTMRYTEPIGN